MSSRVVVVDYGLGNLHSVTKALRHEGASVEVSSDAATIAAADRLIVPGVGAFGDAVALLEARHLFEPIIAFRATGRPMLGICLGMQLLLSESEEFGAHRGFGFIPGRVVKLDVSDKIPHVGWNRLLEPAEGRWDNTVLAGVIPGAQMYFVHSFVPVPADPRHVLAETRYGGVTFAAAVHSDNVTGFQCHPEKSGEIGLQVVRKFLS